MKKIILLAGIMAISMFAKTVDKTGGLAFRFDDNQKLEKWVALAQVFDRYGYPMSLALNMDSDNPYNDATLEFLHKALKNGHELMDHTPDHSVFSFQHPQAEKYADEPWVDHVTGNRVCAKYTIRNDAPQKEARFKFKASVNGNSIELPEEVKRRYWPNSQHVIINGKAYVLRGKDANTFFLESFWREPVDLGRLGEIEVEYASKYYGFSVDARALQEMSKLVQERRAKIGLPPATAWIQPGSPEAIIQADNVRDALASKGYVSGATYQDNAALVFCEPEPMRCAYAMMWGQINLERRPTIEMLKKSVADAVATHRVLISSSHIRTEQFEDELDGFARLHDELLKWCKEQGIMVKTQSEWARILYFSKTRPSENILPSPKVDLNGDNVPDGYVLGKDTVWEKGQISVAGKDYVCGIQRLGGVEKGKNKLALKIKGGTPCVRITFFTNAGKGDTLEFKSKKFSFDVPENTVTLNIDIWNEADEKMVFKGGKLSK